MSRLKRTLIGSSEAFQAFHGLLTQVARSTATVLISGESGTGKGLAARELHALSPCAEGPLVEADLAALTPTLVEALLFGHEEGAFTDAHQARPGLFRRAEGGTIVLDDVDTLPLEIQVKLLRVLQERVVEPVGASTPVPVDVRVVATSSRDLQAMVEEGEFREDLFWRLAVVTLEMPPLRARAGDVPLLTEAMAASIAADRKVPSRDWSAEALEVLENHPWPGNVRELENAIERVLVLQTGGDSSPVAAHELDFLEESTAGMADHLAQEALSHGLTVDTMTQAMMDRAFQEQRGNVSAAARQVGLTRRAFDYRMAHRDDPGREEASA